MKLSWDRRGLRGYDPTAGKRTVDLTTQIQIWQGPDIYQSAYFPRAFRVLEIHQLTFSLTLNIFSLSLFFHSHDLIAVINANKIQAKTKDDLKMHNCIFRFFQFFYFNLFCLIMHVMQ